MEQYPLVARFLLKETHEAMKDH